MRARFIVGLILVAGVAFLLGTNQVLPQPGRGGGFPGGFSGGSSRTFDQYSQGRGFFYISEVTDPDRKARLTAFAQQNGIADGKITAERYQAYIQAYMSGAFRNMPGGSPPGGGMMSGMMGGGTPGGGMPGGGMMGMLGGDPNEMFNRFSGGKDVIRKADLPDPMMQMIFDRMAERMGITDGQITRQQFQGMTQQFMAMRSGGGPGGPPGGFGGGSPDEWSDRRFRERDRNGDGLLNYDEMSDTLKAEREKWDANRDGFIDLNEYKTYSQARSQQWQQERAANQDPRSGAPDWGQFPVIPEEEEKKPTVYRAGKLPKDIPQWFKDLDTDNDAQIGLYEWKNSGRSFDEFNRIDRNGDGFATIDETMRYVGQQKGTPASPGEAVASRDAGSKSSPAGPGFGGGSRGPGSNGPGTSGPGFGGGSRGGFPFGGGTTPGGDRKGFDPRSMFGGKR
jgi:hypothetical protein